MKIALLSRWYWEEHHRHGDEGGTTIQLAEAVAARGHEVVVLSQSPHVDRLTAAKIGALETWLSPRDKRRGFLTGLRDKWAKRTYDQRKVYSDALDLEKFLAQRGPFDVLWAQSESPDGLICAIAAKQGRKLPPVVVQIQALRYRFEHGAPVFTQKQPLGLAFRQATRILANSGMIAENLTAYALPNHGAAEIAAKMRVVYPPLQCAFLTAALNAESDATPVKNRVLFLGALNEGKGALTLLEAIPKTQGATFAVAGNFTEDNAGFARRWEEGKETVRASGADIEYLGAIGSLEVIRQIRLAGVVVLPSLFDAFSRALVEALALGRPVITTDRVGAARLVEQHQSGLVVPPNNPNALAQAIDAVLKPDAPFTANAQRARPQILQEFSVETIAQKIAGQLAEVADRTAPA